MSDTDFYQLFEDPSWATGADDDLRIVQAGLYIKVSPGNGVGDEILIQIDKAIFRRNKRELQERAAEIWPDIPLGEALVRLLGVYLWESMASAQDDFSSLRFDGGGFAPGNDRLTD